ncbi:hypothetical protein V501_03223 [Pseudogymnoascus sp. VKM F-4519 (FW-2642)]|nr:hypothetical protein V501_03223 [Pseudogymnoascus sp. VKM F-4519 (FW-2642)]
MVRITLAAAAILSLSLTPHVAAQDDPSILLGEVGRASNESLLWGPYKPNLYFGVRPKIPKSLSAGLMWAKVDNFQDVQHNFRHTCEQNEGMAGYGWDEYDVRNGGQQTVHDAGNKIDITTSFVKIPGGKHGGSWGVRVKGTPREDAPAMLMTTVVFYATLEGLGSLEVENKRDELGYEGDVTLKGNSAGLGEYKLLVTKGEGRHPTETHDSYKEKPLDRTMVRSMAAAEENLWQIKPLFYQELKGQIEAYVEKYTVEAMPPPWQVYTLPNEPGAGNIQMVQKVFEGPFEFDIMFSSGSATKEVTSEDLTEGIESASKSFVEKFGDVFDLKAPYNGPKYAQFAKSMFSNLFGGIGYFQGDEVVDRSYAPEYDEENEGFWEEAAEARAKKREQLEGPFELYTSVPSRPFFPRGFLWDEGFHLLPIADWDMDIALEIVKSWFNLMDSDGWIGREQILGDEARSKVPPEFQVQYPHYANPPTLFFILDAFVERLSKPNESAIPVEGSPGLRQAGLNSAHTDNPEVANQYLQAIYPLLKKQYHWFRRTQSGDLATYDREAFSSKEAYRWRGRTVQHVLTSGLDDYPRPQPPHPGELHVDLISWMGVMAKSLKNIATYLGETQDVAEFTRNANGILRNIDDLHWSEKEKTFCDATIDEFEENVLVCHKGYISIFPFLTGLIEPDSPRLGAILDLIEDPEELWTDFGIRSLSKSNEFYGTDENYWRGPIWMNMNYLAVRELLKIAQSSSPHAKQAGSIYSRLRHSLVSNVYKSWKETGFAWEQYNPEDGHGQRTQHFTGWTSLVVKIMAMPELEAGKAGGDESHDEL